MLKLTPIAASSSRFAIAERQGKSGLLRIAGNRSMASKLMLMFLKNISQFTIKRFLKPAIFNKNMVTNSELIKLFQEKFFYFCI